MRSPLNNARAEGRVARWCGCRHRSCEPANDPPGSHQALLLVGPPASIRTPPPNPNLVGASSWSTFRGSINVAQDGLSATVDGDLAYGGGRVEEHLSGGWSCTVRATSSALS